MRETPVWFLGWEDPLEKGKATHSSILAWRIPWTVHGVAKSQTQLSNFHFTLNTCVHWLYKYKLVYIYLRLKIWGQWHWAWFPLSETVWEWCHQMTEGEHLCPHQEVTYFYPWEQEGTNVPAHGELPQSPAFEGLCPWRSGHQMAPSRLSRGPTPDRSDLRAPLSGHRVSGLRASGSCAGPLSQPAVGLGEVSSHLGPNFPIWKISFIGRWLAWGHGENDLEQGWGPGRVVEGLTWGLTWGLTAILSHLSASPRQECTSGLLGQRGILAAILL